MIEDFRCKDTAQLWHTGRNRRFANIAQIALRKLVMLHAADTVDDLKVPPANRLEALKGNRAGQYSVRINSQWRLCFRWHNGIVQDVEIVGYH